MGRLAEALSQSLRSEQSETKKAEDAADRFSIEVSFSIDDEDFARELSQALEEIVKERNDLIHQRLIHFDPKSFESCRDLIRELDEQRARIKPQFQALSAICTSLREHHKQLKGYAESESFADDLKRAEEHHRDESTDS
jgi:predicted nuclease with TOPRIM domain